MENQLEYRKYFTSMSIVSDSAPLIAQCALIRVFSLSSAERADDAAHVDEFEKHGSASAVLVHGESTGIHPVAGR